MLTNHNITAKPSKKLQTKQDLTASGIRFCLPPDDSYIRVVFNDLVEGGEVDACYAADLVGAVAAREQAADPQYGVHAVVEPVGSRWVA